MRQARIPIIFSCIFYFFVTFYLIYNKSAEIAELFTVFYISCLLITILSIYLIRSLFLNLTILLFFVGYPLSFPLVFLNPDEYSATGFSGLGDYNFLLDHTSEIFYYVLPIFIIFFLTSLILDKVFLFRYQFIQDSSMPKLEVRISKTLVSNIFLFLVFIQIPLSFFMFYYKAGIVGLEPEPLPFKLAGILYYFRIFLVPTFIGLYLFTKKGDVPKYALLIIFFEIFTASLTSVSRSLTLMHAIPVLFYLGINRKIYTSILFGVFTALAILYCTIARNFIFALELDNFDLFLLFNALASFTEDFDIMLLVAEVPKLLILRIGGFRELCATYFNDVNYVGNFYFLSSYFGLDLYDFSIATSIFGFSPKQAFGVSIDSISMMFLSTNNYIEISVMVFIWVFFLVFVERGCQQLLIDKIQMHSYFLLLFIIYVLFYVIPAFATIFFVLPIFLSFFNLVDFKRPL